MINHVINHLFNHLIKHVFSHVFNHVFNRVFNHLFNHVLDHVFNHVFNHVHTAIEAYSGRSNTNTCMREQRRLLGEANEHKRSVAALEHELRDVKSAVHVETQRAHEAKEALEAANKLVGDVSTQQREHGKELEEIRSQLHIKAESSTRVVRSFVHAFTRPTSDLICGVHVWLKTRFHTLRRRWWCGMKTDE